MNLYKEVIKNEVFPATGCTEPISCAYAAAIAGEHLAARPEELILTIDPGTYKNGATVTVPFSGGARGNLIAAIIGAFVADASTKLQLLMKVTPQIFADANKFLLDGSAKILCDPTRSSFFVKVELSGGGHRASCTLQGGHTNVVSIEQDGKTLFSCEVQSSASPMGYRDEMRSAALLDLFGMVERLDGADLAQIKEGVLMNLRLADEGMAHQKTAYQLQHIHDRGYMCDDLFFKTKIKVASAIDARMAGVQHAAMTSGGSGNQGVVTILGPYIVGSELGISEATILKSIGLAHLMNSYTKSFIGELSAICGCAMSAGLSVATAIVYQQAGFNIQQISLAINNVIGDLGGMVCDGAKVGCALKAITSVDAALRSAFMALANFGLTEDDGVLGRSAEESIFNLGRLTVEGMTQVDPLMLRILEQKLTTK